MVITKDIAEQLTDIYYNYEWWSLPKMEYGDALAYHRQRLNDGRIVTYIIDGEVLGYYEREYVENHCFLRNIWVKTPTAFKELKEHFFKEMPYFITDIIGQKQKLGGKWMKAIIRRRHGNS